MIIEACIGILVQLGLLTLSCLGSLILCLNLCYETWVYESSVCLSTQSKESCQQTLKNKISRLSPWFEVKIYTDKNYSYKYRKTFTQIVFRLKDKYKESPFASLLKRDLTYRSATKIPTYYKSVGSYENF